MSDKGQKTDSGESFRPLAVEKMYGEIMAGSAIEASLKANSFDATLAAANVLKHSPIQQTLLLEFEKGNVVLCKSFIEKGLLAALKRGYRGAKAALASARSNQFTAAGFRTPKNYGYLISRTGFMTCQSFQFVEFLGSAKTLAETFEYDKVGSAVRESILTRLANDLAMLHQGGCIHGDAKLSNLLYHQEQIIFIDLDGFAKAQNNNSMAYEVARLMVGLYEADIAESEIYSWFAQYSGYRDCDKASLLEKVIGPVGQIEQKHQKKYQGRRKKGLSIEMKNWLGYKNNVSG